MKPTLVIMAAGMGSRYGGLKQLDPMGPNGEILLEYSIFDAIRAGFGKVVFIIRKEFEALFREAVGSKFSDTIEVDYAFQELTDLPDGFTVPEGREKPWGTAHAIYACRHVVNTAFAVQNADDFYGAQAYDVLTQAVQQISTDSKDSFMVGFQVANTLSPSGTVSRGICQSENGRLTDCTECENIARNAEGAIEFTNSKDEQGLLNEETLCSMNFWGFTPAFFDQLETKFTQFLREQGTEMKSEWYIPTVVDELLKADETSVQILTSTDHWFGVTYPEDKATVQASIATLHQTGRYPAKLWE